MEPLQAILLLSTYMDSVRESDVWIVLVCGSTETMASLHDHLVFFAAAECQAKFSGRTIRFPNGGALSVGLSGHCDFLPTDAKTRLVEIS